MRSLYPALAALLLSLSAHGVEPYWELQQGKTIADVWGPDAELLESAGLSWTHGRRAVILYLKVGDELWRCPDFSNQEQYPNVCSRLRRTGD